MSRVQTRWGIEEAIRRERDRQDAKWGFPQDHTVVEWMSILGEEYGEACQEANRVHFGKKDYDDLRAELVQVAAVCVAILEEIGPEFRQVSYAETSRDASDDEF